MVQRRVSSGAVQRGSNRWRYDKYGSHPRDKRGELIFPRTGNDRTLMSSYQYGSHSIIHVSYDQSVSKVRPLSQSASVIDCWA